MTPIAQSALLLLLLPARYTHKAFVTSRPLERFRHRQALACFGRLQFNLQLSEIRVKRFASLRPGGLHRAARCLLAVDATGKLF